MTAPVTQLIDADLASDLAAAALDLARRFSTGATLWCIAPGWEPHAQHIAVEFVHPVIVGKRALPAVALTGTDPLASARVSTRSGDVVIAVADADDRDTLAVMRRGAAWGVTTIWIGHGARPESGAADHVLWLDDPDPSTPATGQFVLLYHLLWELTHVCFEHPGLLTVPTACTEDVCITCSDEGRPGEVISASVDSAARVRTADGVETVMTMLVDPVRAGDVVLVHAGMAITKFREGPRS